MRVDVYEPLDEPKPLGENIWIVDGPLVRMSVGAGLSIPFPTRMVVIRLASGALFVWSPTQLSDALRERVRALGDVRHLISPNKIHYAHVGAWKRAHPGAIAWASPGVRERAAAQGIDAPFDRDLGDAPEPAWAAEIDQMVFRGSRYLEEVVFFHRASRTLVLADLVENFEPDKLGPPLRALARLGGVLHPDGKTPADLRATFTGRKALARASYERMRAWEPERVVIAHGRWYERDGARELDRAFRWLR